jgi:hypothetical protein
MCEGNQAVVAVVYSLLDRFLFFFFFSFFSLSGLRPHNVVNICYDGRSWCDGSWRLHTIDTRQAATTTTKES